jgi:hypothetical protein
MEPRLYYGDGDPGKWASEIEAWEGLGATHLSLNTMGCGFDTPEAHLQALRRFAEMMDIS